MGGTRAVIASLGASISIVACAALGLFAVSVLFAYPGIAGSLNGSGSSPTLVVATRVSKPSTVPAARAAARPLRVSMPAVRTSSKPQTASVKRPASAIVDARTGSGRAPRPSTTSSVAELAPVAPPPAISPPAATKPKAGDGVRELGDTLAGTVQKTGDGVGAVAKPLGPPVSKAVQDVLNLAVKAISDLLMKTTGGLAGVLDATTRR
jgi:hypothetical protein